MLLNAPAELTREILGLMSLDRLRQRGFLQNLVVVMTSTGLAQVITVVASPVLSRFTARVISRSTRPFFR